MIATVFKDRATKYFIIIATLFFLAVLIIEKINGRFWLNDFKVMYLSAEALLNQEQVYGVSFGLASGYFKYSPFTLLLFVPYSLIPYDIAAIIHFLIISFCAIATIILLERIINQHLLTQRKKNTLVLLAILFCVVVHLVRELHLGNINMILLFLLSLSLKFILDEKNSRSGFLLALVILAKPYFFICLLPFLLFKRFKFVRNCIFFIILFVGISGLFIGISKSIPLYSEWFVAMMQHSDYLSSNHTIFSLFDIYAGISISSDYSIYLLAILGLISCIYFWKFASVGNVDSNSDFKQNSALIIHFFLLIALVPSILITDTEHFLFSLPLIAILLSFLRTGKKYIWIPLFILMMLMYGGNSSDLLGKSLASKHENMGLLGLSNLIIIGTIIFLFSFKKNMWLKMNIHVHENNVVNAETTVKD